MRRTKRTGSTGKRGRMASGGGRTEAWPLRRRTEGGWLGDGALGAKRGNSATERREQNAEAGREVF